MSDTRCKDVKSAFQLRATVMQDNLVVCRLQHQSDTWFFPSKAGLHAGLWRHPGSCQPQVCSFLFFTFIPSLLELESDGHIVTRGLFCFWHTCFPAQRICTAYTALTSCVLVIFCKNKATPPVALGTVSMMLHQMTAMNAASLDHTKMPGTDCFGETKLVLHVPSST